MRNYLAPSAWGPGFGWAGVAAAAALAILWRTGRPLAAAAALATYLMVLGALVLRRPAGAYDDREEWRPVVVLSPLVLLLTVGLIVPSPLWLAGATVLAGALFAGLHLLVARVGSDIEHEVASLRDLAASVVDPDVRSTVLGLCDTTEHLGALIETAGHRPLLTAEVTRRWLAPTREALTRYCRLADDPSPASREERRRFERQTLPRVQRGLAEAHERLHRADRLELATLNEIIALLGTWPPEDGSAPDTTGGDGTADRGDRPTVATTLTSAPSPPGGRTRQRRSSTP